MTTDAAQTDVKVPAHVRKSIEKFLTDHGDAASAVLQPVGRVGVRITLVGADGILGDQMVADLPTAKAVVESFDAITVSEWDRELTSIVTPRVGHWKKMAGWVANQTRFPKARNEV
ncbi:hypothetical protein [Antrihabitans spumae]|jgi:hypothetical protein|uniref:Uncharacterized protein n=1 Tax=Antrihabitans spumae TaxID=3373370 RepID=A0ABW7JQD9_9NOCA